MTQLPHLPDEYDPSDEPDFTFDDVVEFTSSYWRWLLVGALAGALLGLFWAFIKVSYRANTVMSYVESEHSVRPWELQGFIAMNQVLSNPSFLTAEKLDMGAVECLRIEHCWRETVHPFYGVSGLDDPLSGLEAKFLGQTDVEGRKRLTGVIGVAVTTELRGSEAAVSQSSRIVEVIRKVMEVLTLGDLRKSLEAALEAVLAERAEIEREAKLTQYQLSQLELLEERLMKKSSELARQEREALVKPSAAEMNRLETFARFQNGIGEKSLVGNWSFNVPQPGQKSALLQDRLVEAETKKVELEMRRLRLAGSSGSASNSDANPQASTQWIADVRQIMASTSNVGSALDQVQRIVSEVRAVIGPKESAGLKAIQETLDRIRAQYDQYNGTGRVIYTSLVRQSHYVAAVVTGLMSGLILSLVLSLFSAKLAAYRERHSS